MWMIAFFLTIDYFSCHSAIDVNNISQCVFAPAEAKSRHERGNHTIYSSIQNKLIVFAWCSLSVYMRPYEATISLAFFIFGTSYHIFVDC